MAAPAEWWGAARKGDTESMQTLLRTSKDLALASDSEGLTALHWACRKGHLDIVRLLLDTQDPRLDINQQNLLNGYTPLHYAASKCHQPVVQFLLSRGANKGMLDRQGQPAGAAFHRRITMFHRRASAKKQIRTLLRAATAPTLSIPGKPKLDPADGKDPPHEGSDPQQSAATLPTSDPSPVAEYMVEEPVPDTPTAQLQLDPSASMTSSAPTSPGILTPKEDPTWTRDRQPSYRARAFHQDSHISTADSPGLSPPHLSPDHPPESESFASNGLTLEQRTPDGPSPERRTPAAPSPEGRSPAGPSPQQCTPDDPVQERRTSGLTLEGRTPEGSSSERRSPIGPVQDQCTSDGPSPGQYTSSGALSECQTSDDPPASPHTPDAPRAGEEDRPTSPDMPDVPRSPPARLSPERLRPAAPHAIWGEVGAILVELIRLLAADVDGKEACVDLANWAVEIQHLLGALEGLRTQGGLQAPPGLGELEAVRDTLEALAEQAQESFDRGLVVWFALSTECHAHQSSVLHHLQRAAQMQEVALPADSLRLAQQLLERQSHKIELEGLARLHELDPVELQLPEEEEWFARGATSRCLPVQVDGQRKTAKVYHLKHPGLLRDDPTKLVQFKAELAATCALSHPNLLNVLGSVTTLPQKLVLVMDHAENSNLRSALNNPVMANALNQSQVLRDVAEGMQYLYSMDLQHRRLMSHKVLLGPDSKAMVAGFGISDSDHLVRTYGCVTDPDSQARMVCWTAPELMRTDSEQPPAMFTEQCDVFSFGVIAWEIVTRLLPWGERPERDICKQVMQGRRLDLPTKMSEHLRALIRQCWAPGAVDRPTFAEVVLCLSAPHLMALS